MISCYKTPNKLWCLEEEGYRPEKTKHYEGLLTQGSQGLHLRASYEEGLAAAPQDESYMRLPANVTVEKPRHPRSKAGCYIPGVTGIHPLLNEVVVNLPNPLTIRLWAEGEPVDMDSPQMGDYARHLDMRDGVLYRSFTWKTPKGQVFWGISRYVSRAEPGLIVQHLEVSADYEAKIRLEAAVDTRVTTNGYNHFTAREEFRLEGFFGAAVDTDNGDHVEMVSVLFPNAGEPEAWEGVLTPGKTMDIWRLTLAASSRDEESPCREVMCRKLKELIVNPDALYAPHAAAWDALWEKGRVEIQGDEEAQRAVNMALYHLLRSANPRDSRVAVCAKGYAGEAYFGHFFWDTEMYLLPYFLYTNPETARALVGFRLNTLEGARKNAAHYGYPGARYPWESSLTGEEQCPNWQYCDHEVHVTADVAFGIWHTYTATKDLEFLKKAMPVLAETARYWLARCHFDGDGSVHINGVMGPDEYICFCNDNAYTNTLVKKALGYTLESCRLTGSELLSQQEQEKIRACMEGLTAYRDSRGILQQCRDFDRYEEPDFETLWPDRSRPFGGTVSQERNYRTKALKQADVLMLPYLFPDIMGQEELEKTYDYYYPYTTHDSSLSYIIHAILKARMGHGDEALTLFRKSLGIDLEGGAAEGIHIANCGGIWQGVVLGFCGMGCSYQTDKLSFAPHLPRHWQKVSFPVVWQGQKHFVEITHEEVVIDGEKQK